MFQNRHLEINWFTDRGVFLDIQTNTSILPPTALEFIELFHAALRQKCHFETYDNNDEKRQHLRHSKGFISKKTSKKHQQKQQLPCDFEDSGVL